MRVQESPDMRNAGRLTGNRAKERYEGGVSSTKKDERPLAQTRDYDGLEGSASGYEDFDEPDGSTLK